MKIMIAGGTGFIGQALIKKLLLKGYKIVVIGRSEKKIKETFKNEITAVSWDNFANSENIISQLQNTDYVINLAGANIAHGRWTEKRKSEIINSRVKTTTIIVKRCLESKNSNIGLINANGIGVYGYQSFLKNGLPPALTENDDFIQGVTKSNFLKKVGLLWDEPLKKAEEQCLRVIKLRFAPVLSKKGGVLPRLLFSFKWGLGAKLSNGHQPFSWISIDDAISAIIFLMENNFSGGRVNLVSPQTVTQYQFAKTLGKVLRRPTVITLPASLIKLVLGEMGEALLLQGQHVFPKVLLDQGFIFQYSNLATALKHILKPS